MIWKVAFVGAAVYFNWYLLRLLYVARTRRYVMALTDPFRDIVETPQTQSANPQKFWANVIVAIILLPIAWGGLWVAAAQLYAAISSQHL